MKVQWTRLFALALMVGLLGACQSSYDAAAERDEMLMEDAQSAKAQADAEWRETYEQMRQMWQDRSVAPPFGHEVEHRARPYHEGHFATYKNRGEFLSDDYPQGRNP